MESPILIKAAAIIEVFSLISNLFIYIICICFLVILSICGYFYSASFSDNILSNCIYSFQPSPASLGESPQHRHRIAQVVIFQRNRFLLLMIPIFKYALTGCCPHISKLKVIYMCVVVVVVVILEITKHH